MKIGFDCNTRTIETVFPFCDILIYHAYNIDLFDYHKSALRRGCEVFVFDVVKPNKAKFKDIISKLNHPNLVVVLPNKSYLDIIPNDRRYRVVFPCVGVTRKKDLEKYKSIMKEGDLIGINNIDMLDYEGYIHFLDLKEAYFEAHKDKLKSVYSCNLSEPILEYLEGENLDILWEKDELLAEEDNYVDDVNDNRKLREKLKCVSKKLRM